MISFARNYRINESNHSFNIYLKINLIPYLDKFIVLLEILKINQKIMTKNTSSFK